MKFILVALLGLSQFAAAGTKMGEDAVEMLDLLTHRDVVSCIDDIDRLNMVNVKIEKRVARCPGCTTYTITGYPRVGGDVVRGEKATVTIAGRAERATFGFGYAQRYTCTVKQ
jgi:hypothetical protein